MKNMKSNDWTTHLGESGLPSDDFTFSEAGNGGLDGYTFDTPYNEGVLDGARLPETKGLSGLPDGLIMADGDVQIGFGTDIELNDAENGSNFDTMLSFAEGGEDVSPATAKAASLVNLDWLDPTQPQDPDRLPLELRPDQPPLNSVPALEAAWGSNEPTTGFSLVPAKDLEVIAYEEFIKEDQVSGLPGTAKTASEKQDAILQAVRRSHWGHDIRSILADLKRAVGDTPIGRKVALEIKSDHGLAGKVFIRAAAFPGLKNGKWVKEIKKALRTARYVITDDQMVADKLSMQKVADVPWGQALREYTPMLHASGFKLASGNPKEVLRKAFLGGPVTASISEAYFPEHHQEMASSSDAREMLSKAAKAAAPTVKTSNDVAVERKLHKVLVKLAQLVKAGRLSTEDALRLRDQGQKGLAPVAIMKAAASIMARPSNASSYAGPVFVEAPSTPKRANAEDQAAGIEESLKKKALVHLAKLVRQNLVTEDSARDIARTCKTASEINAEAARIAASATSETYKGAVQTAAILERHSSVDVDPSLDRILKVAKSSGIKASEFQSMLRWTRQQMSEGVVGKDLNALIRAKFATPILKVAKDLLREIRAEHEGLSGHLYVDAAAYATANGTSGCERGGLRHRGNTLKTVLAMSKCASCVNHNANGFCSVYNKKLADQVSVEDPKSYQKEAIRLADASDSEITASLFDPGEFNLRNDPMESVALDNEVSHKDLGDVLFGGLEV